MFQVDIQCCCAHDVHIFVPLDLTITAANFKQYDYIPTDHKSPFAAYGGEARGTVLYTSSSSVLLSITCVGSLDGGIVPGIVLNSLRSFLFGGGRF